MESLDRIITVVSRILETPVTSEDSMSTVPVWDSLSYINIVSALEEDFNIVFSNEELEELDSINKIHALISSRITQE